MHYFQFFIYLINSSMSCVEYITFFVLIILLFVVEPGSGSCLSNPMDGPAGQSKAKQEGELPAPDIVMSVVTQGYIILHQPDSLRDEEREK